MSMKSDILKDVNLNTGNDLYITCIYKNNCSKLDISIDVYIRRTQQRRAQYAIQAQGCLFSVI